MKNFFNNNKKIVVAFFVLIIIFPVLILCHSPIGFIPRDIGIAIVGYGGAIIGGFLTLYGVWWTIEDNNIKRKKELELQYCPILKADIVEKNSPIYNLCSEITVLYKHKWFNDAELEYLDKLVKISNIGRGEIQKVELNLENCSIITTIPYELAEEMNLDDSYILCDGIFDFIPINGAFYLYVGLPKIRKEYNEQLKEKKFIRLEISLRITISGVFSTEEQEYRLHFFVDSKFEDGYVSYNFDSMTFMKI